MPKKKDIMQFQRVRRYKAGVAAINAAANAAGVATALVAHGKKLDLDMVAYGRLSENNQEAICAAVLAGKAVEGYADRDAVAAAFDAVLLERTAAEFALNLVNEALSAERLAWVLEGHWAALGIDEDAFEAYDELEDKGAICEELLVGDGDLYADEAAFVEAFYSEIEYEAGGD